MDIQKLRIRLGPHEFEAEGPANEVAAQFEAWKELVTSIGAALPSLPGNGHKPQIRQESGTRTDDALEPETERYSREILGMFDVDDKGERITLKIHPSGKDADEDAILLLALGYRRLKNHESTLSTQIAESLRISGLNSGRMDRAVAPLINANLLLRSGRAKATRYRLTATGTARAERIAQELTQKL